MYGEAKLAFFVYLWYPKTKVCNPIYNFIFWLKACSFFSPNLAFFFSTSIQGTTYVYGSFFRPYIAKHETDIDRNLVELKTRAGDLALIYWQKTASYAQTRIFDILQFIAAQSTPKRPVKVHFLLLHYGKIRPSPTSAVFGLWWQSFDLTLF